MEQVVLKPANLPEQLRLLARDLRNECSVQEQLEEALKRDGLVERILDAVRQGISMREITVAECSQEKGQLYYRGQRYIPESPELQLHLIREHHSTPLAGHPGRSKTFDLLSRQYY
jgi:hypothetical protein